MIPTQILSLVDESALKEILESSIDRTAAEDIIAERKKTLVEGYILDIAFSLLERETPEWFTTWWNNGRFLGVGMIHSDILDYAKTL